MSVSTNQRCPITGKIDAANADDLLGGQRFRRYLRPGRALVLDMTKVAFFAHKAYAAF